MRHRCEPRPRYKSTRIERGRLVLEGEERDKSPWPAFIRYTWEEEGRGLRRRKGFRRRRVFALIRPINRFARLAWVGLSGFGGGDTVALFGA